MSTELTLSGLVYGTTDPRTIKLMEECSTLIAAGFPVMGMDLITDKKGRTKVYINRLGCEWLINQDDRGVRSVDSDCLMDAMTHDKGYGKYRCTITMGNGARYVAHGSAQENERWRCDEMAETRAFNRAAKIATAQTVLAHATIPIADEAEIEVTEMPRFAQTQAGRTSGNDTIMPLDESLDGVRVTIVSRREWARGGDFAQGMSRVGVVVTSDGEMSTRWLNDQLWDRITLALIGTNGEVLNFPITDCMFKRHEVVTRETASRPSRTVWVWDLMAYPQGDYDPAPDVNEIGSDEIPF